MKIDLTDVASRHWQDIPANEIFPGVRKRELWQGANGAKAPILEFDPGGKFTQLDVHERGPEEVLVVSGVFSDGVHDDPAGSFMHSPTGSVHIPQAASGYALFVFSPEG